MVAEAKTMSDKEAFEHFRAFVHDLTDKEKQKIKEFLYEYKEVDELLERIWKFCL